VDFTGGFFLGFNADFLDFGNFHEEQGKCKSNKQKALCVLPSLLGRRQPECRDCYFQRRIPGGWERRHGPARLLRQRVPRATAGSTACARNGRCGRKLMQLGNTVVDWHSWRKQQAKSEGSALSRSCGSLLLFPIMNRWRMHPNAPATGFAVTGIPLTSQAP